MNRRPNILIIDGLRYFQKYTTTQRVQAIIQLFSVIVLAFSGISLRYADNEIAQKIYQLMGGPDVVPNIHRTAGVVLLSVFVYHTYYWIRIFFKNHVRKLIRERNFSVGNVKREFLSQVMVPNKKDLKDIIDHIKYITFWSSTPALHDRIMWKDKFEYYSQYWGITVIGIAGLALWWRDEVSLLLPGIVLNVAYIVHSYEALLAVLFLFFIHWYHEYYCPEKLPIPTGFFSGYVSEKQMIHEHYARYVRLMIAAGLKDQIKPFHH